MANPRQRRKQRSSSHKPVHQSRRAGKNLKKQPAIRGPKVLQEAWDKRKTVRQNYAALGLAASLTPTESGGVEKILVPHAAEDHDAPAPEASTSAGASSGFKGIPKGFGRIIRDEDGNIVDVELGDEDAEETPMEDIVGEVPDPALDKQLAPWVHLGSKVQSGRPSENGSATPIVQALEGLAREGGKRAPRHPSAGELATLRRLVQKYGEDVEKMARDRKLNTDQRTAGELSRAIKRAGGIAELATGS